MGGAAPLQSPSMSTEIGSLEKLLWFLRLIWVGSPSQIYYGVLIVRTTDHGRGRVTKVLDVDGRETTSATNAEARTSIQKLKIA